MNDRSDKVNKIAILGRPGSGKSTFALKLSEQLNLPVYHLDKIFFTDHWAKQDYATFLELQQNLVNQPQWIIDGNALRSVEMRYKEADLIIVFILPRWKCFVRILKRRFERRNPKIDDRAFNCPERIRYALLEYTWTFKKRLFPMLAELEQAYPSKRLVVIRNDQEAQTILKELSA
jgi:adenylate kinase family enzyme